MNGLYHIKKPSLTPYFQRTKDLAKLFRCLQIQHVGRGNNGQDNALASLATSLTHPMDDYLIVHIGERRVVSSLSSIIEEDVLLACNTDLQECDAQCMESQSTLREEDWHEPLIQYLMDKGEPFNPDKHAKIR